MSSYGGQKKIRAANKVHVLKTFIVSERQQKWRKNTGRNFHWSCLRKLEEEVKVADIGSGFFLALPLRGAVKALGKFPRFPVSQCVEPTLKWLFDNTANGAREMVRNSWETKLQIGVIKRREGPTTTC